MRVRVIRQCDVNQEGRRKALFPGQVYELHDDVAESLIGVGHVIAYVPDTARESVRIIGRPRGGRGRTA